MGAVGWSTSGLEGPYSCTSQWDKNGFGRFFVLAYWQGGKGGTAKKNKRQLQEIQSQPLRRDFAEGLLCSIPSARRAAGQDPRGTSGCSRSARPSCHPASSCATS